MQHPRENPRLVGHHDAEKIFLDAITSGRIAGSWLISGAKGVGKSTLAYRLARYLLSQEIGAGQGMDSMFAPAELSKPSDLSIDENHPIFNRMLHQTLGDIKIVEPNYAENKTLISVDEIRSIGKFIRQTAAESQYRILIIDSADDMNRNAANALLKILEEPPKNTIILLISHSAGKLLPTIRSRCRFIKLRPLDNKNVTDLLRSMVLDADNDDETINIIDEDNLKFSAYLSDGAVGLAMELYSNSGLQIYAKILNILQSTPHINLALVHKLGEELAKKDAHADWKIFTYLISWLLTKIINSQISAQIIPTFVAGESEIRQQIMANYSPAQLVDIWQNINQLMAQGEGLNMDKKLTVREVFTLFIK